MLKNIKWRSIIVSILYIAAGLLLLILPGQVSDLICDILGIGIIVSGCLNVVTYFMMDLKESLFRDEFVNGVVLVLVGALVIYQKAVLQNVIPYVMAVVILASGVSKLQDSIDAARIGYKANASYVVMALISIVLGVVVLFGLIPGDELLFQIIGASLLYCGVTDLVFTLILSGKIRKFMKESEEPSHQEDVVDAVVTEQEQSQEAPQDPEQ